MHDTRTDKGALMTKSAYAKTEKAALINFSVEKEVYLETLHVVLCCPIYYFFKRFFKKYFVCLDVKSPENDREVIYVTSTTDSTSMRSVARKRAAAIHSCCRFHRLRGASTQQSHGNESGQRVTGGA